MENGDDHLFFTFLIELSDTDLTNLLLCHRGLTFTRDDTYSRRGYNLIFATGSLYHWKETLNTRNSELSVIFTQVYTLLSKVGCSNYMREKVIR